VGSLGHPSDDETGLIYLRARHYDLVCGRFGSEDPAGGDGKNAYLYAKDDPTNGRDYGGYIILEGPIAVSTGMDIEEKEGEGVGVAYNYITNRIALAVGREDAEIMLELLPDSPTTWSAGEYQFLKDEGALLIRLNGGMPKAELAQAFCRELAEFFARQEGGGVLTQDVWEVLGPELYQTLMGLP
jgi:RHS repeat-associated protein